MDSNEKLDVLWTEYRQACLEMEGGANFVPAIWERIECRRSFSFTFSWWAWRGAAVSLLLCVLLAVLTFVSSVRPAQAVPPTYTDALLADQSAETTYYAEAIRPVSAIPAFRQAGR